MSESEGEDETADKVVELVRSPPSVRSSTSPAQNGDADDVFLFDNNIPSIATRIPTRAEPADVLALRRRNRILRLISESRCKHSLQRSVSVQLDDRRRQRHHHVDDVLGTSWPNGELAEYLPSRLTPTKSLDDVGDDAADAELRTQRQDGREQNQQLRGPGAQSRTSLAHSGVRRKNVVSVDACCTGGSEAMSMKRRGTLRDGNALRDGKVVVADDITSDDDNAELSCHLCNGLDDQTKNDSSTSER